MINMEPKVDPTVEAFEQAICEYTGAPYAVAVSSNTNGIFLCLEMLKYFDIKNQDTPIRLPSRTYYSVGMSVLHAGFKISFMDFKWSGEYRLGYTNIHDSALRLERGMYEPGTIKVLSTQYRKPIPIGRGGVILTDNKEYADHLRLIRLNGNEEISGWNMYMTPEQAARGLSLLERMKEPGCIGGSEDYEDISGWSVWR